MRMHRPSPTRTQFGARRARLSRVAIGLALALTLVACGNGSSKPAAVSGDRDTDIAFAQLMIPHHRQAVGMADLALKYAVSPEVKALATQIQGAQDPEIEQMTGWLQSWEAPLEMPGLEGTDMGDHSGMDMGGLTMSGMMSSADLNGLAQARGKDFDRQWLTMMIAHHEGAVLMARQVLETTSDGQVKSLAESIVAGQTAEIDTMQQLLADSSAK